MLPADGSIARGCKTQQSQEPVHPLHTVSKSKFSGQNYFYQFDGKFGLYGSF